MSYKYIWEDPKQFKINKEDGHSVFMPFDNEEEALSEKMSEYKFSLDGEWQFFWQRGVDNQIEGFEKESFSANDWKSIKVPS
ncbi:MAG: hypothetical protein IKR97_08570, partial [Eubacterium sp.]|nr:hypothetical protein [Eubacterium sp.]